MRRCRWFGLADRRSVHEGLSISDISGYQVFGNVSCILDKKFHRVSRLVSELGGSQILRRTGGFSKFTNQHGTIESRGYRILILWQRER